eukprot:PLAT12807.1.p1 GENE.PLAT12807.1~~PLAT12807.1.p1  ORF type:complete len:417 (-),score=235.82 PLAT12807.1:167-1417(-)
MARCCKGGAFGGADGEEERLVAVGSLTFLLKPSAVTMKLSGLLLLLFALCALFAMAQDTDVDTDVDGPLGESGDTAHQDKAVVALEGAAAKAQSLTQDLTSNCDTEVKETLEWIEEGLDLGDAARAGRKQALADALKAKIDALKAAIAALRRLLERVGVHSQTAHGLYNNIHDAAGLLNKHATSVLKLVGDSLLATSHAAGGAKEEADGDVVAFLQTLEETVRGVTIEGLAEAEASEKPVEKENLDKEAEAEAKDAAKDAGAAQGGGYHDDAIQMRNSLFAGTKHLYEGYVHSLSVALRNYRSSTADVQLINNLIKAIKDLIAKKEKKLAAMEAELEGLLAALGKDDGDMLGELLRYLKQHGEVIKGNCVAAAASSKALASQNEQAQALIRDAKIPAATALLMGDDISIGQIPTDL